MTYRTKSEFPTSHCRIAAKTNSSCCCSQPVSRMLAAIIEWLTDLLTGAIMECRKAGRSRAVATPHFSHSYTHHICEDARFSFWTLFGLRSIWFVKSLSKWNPSHHYLAPRQFRLFPCSHVPRCVLKQPSQVVLIPPLLLPLFQLEAHSQAVYQSPLLPLWHMEKLVALSHLGPMGHPQDARQAYSGNLPGNHQSFLSSLAMEPREFWMIHRGIWSLEP